MEITKGHITIESWMRSELDLKGNELICYALIYCFSQDGQSECFGSINYICSWLGCTRHTAISTTQSLMDKGLIEKSYGIYKDQPCSTYRVVQNLHYPSAKIAPNNNIDNNNNSDSNNRFKRPSLDEVISYCLERGNNVDPQRFFDYYESNGWMVGKSKMKDWKACIRTWERNTNNYGTNKQQPDQASDRRNAIAEMFRNAAAGVHP